MRALLLVFKEATVSFRSQWVDRSDSQQTYQICNFVNVSGKFSFLSCFVSLFLVVDTALTRI